mgnify:FL=1
MAWKKRTPLRQLKLKQGSWWHSARFSEVATAHDWGLTPSEFDAKPDVDKATMIAYTASVGMMQAWESQKQSEEMRKKSSKK